MMQKKSDIEMELAKIIKVRRTLIRLKHSLNADEEINNILPDTKIEFERAIQNGELLGLPANLEEILGS